MEEWGSSQLWGQYLGHETVDYSRICPAVFKKMMNRYNRSDVEIRRQIDDGINKFSEAFFVKQVANLRILKN